MDRPLSISALALRDRKGVGGGGSEVTPFSPASAFCALFALKSTVVGIITPGVSILFIPLCR